MNTPDGTITIPAAQLVPGDCMWDPRTETALVVLWREMRALDGRIAVVLAFPDGRRINRALTHAKEVQIFPSPATCGQEIRQELGPLRIDTLT